MVTRRIIGWEFAMHMILSWVQGYDKTKAKYFPSFFRIFKDQKAGMPRPSHASVNSRLADHESPTLKRSQQLPAKGRWAQLFLFEIKS